MLVSALAFHSWQAPHAQEKCIRKAKAARVPNVRNLLIFSGIAIRKTFHRSRCQPGTAVFAVACPFFGTKESGAKRDRFGIERSERCGTVCLRRTACNSEFVNSLLEGGSLHSKVRCRPVGTCHNPIALFESSNNLLTFRFLQNVMKGAICRFQRSGFYRRAGLGKFKIADIDAQG